MQLHYVVVFDTNKKQWAIDWDSQEVRFGFEHIFDMHMQGWVSPNFSPFTSKVDSSAIKVLNAGLDMLNTVSDNYAKEQTAN